MLSSFVTLLIPVRKMNNVLELMQNYMSKKFLFNSSEMSFWEDYKLRTKNEEHFRLLDEAR